MAKAATPKKKTNSSQYPSVLAFERKISPSDAIMFSVSSDGEKEILTPIEVRTKSVLGTKSSETVTDSKKGGNAYAEGNPQTVDVASLSMTSDRLAVRFTVRFLSGFGMPSSCNNAGFSQDLYRAASHYMNRSLLRNLSLRYAQAIAEGRFLFRNKVNAQDMVVKCQVLGRTGEVAETLVFKSAGHGVNKVSLADETLKKLASVISVGLRGEDGFGSTLRVTGYVTMAEGQEVFPSQEMTIDKDSSSNKKSKTLYRVSYGNSDNVAGLHSQKVGNALRTIDNGYLGAVSAPNISVEPYGAVVSCGVAHRTGGNSFYNLFNAFIQRHKDGESVLPDTEDFDDHTPLPDDDFVVGCLIRGGVYSGSQAAAKEKETEGAAAPEAEAETEGAGA